MDKEQMEAQMAAEMNADAVARLKRETELQAASEKIWFEDDERVTLRDGSVRTIPPLLFGDARTFMQKVKTVNIDVILFNFGPNGQSPAETDLYDILAMAFKDHSDMVTVVNEGGRVTYQPNRDYIDRNVDIRMARQIIDIMLDVNALKK
ncbi:hypothetical protein [Paenibacillus sp. NPDC058071]|uniref:hypothetical protein n=1 Tax=Paenibacillus sp. NPDC058071 TaxID=3346326 RepID=UPI0036DC70D4